jgi:guanylate kinase
MDIASIFSYNGKIILNFFMKSRKYIKNVLVISGPTGSGENTIANKIAKAYPIFKRLVAATTRKKRPGEKNGVDYYFFSKARFFREIEKGRITEYTHVKNRGDYYGSYKPDFEDKVNSGFNIIVTPDLVGTKFYKENYNATTIFLDVESIDVIAKRLKRRDPSITSEELEKRMRNAKREIRREKSYYDYCVINKEGKIKEAIMDIINIIKKEGYKV